MQVSLLAMLCLVMDFSAFLNTDIGRSSVSSSKYTYDSVPSVTQRLDAGDRLNKIFCICLDIKPNQHIHGASMYELITKVIREQDKINLEFDNNT